MIIIMNLWHIFTVDLIVSGLVLSLTIDGNALTHTLKHTHTHTHTSIHTHAHIHTHIHTHKACARTHTHNHENTRIT